MRTNTEYVNFHVVLISYNTKLTIIEILTYARYFIANEDFWIYGIVCISDTGWLRKLYACIYMHR